MPGYSPEAPDEVKVPEVAGKNGLTTQEELDSISEFERNFSDGKSFLSTHYQECEDNEEFAYADQWDKNERREREMDATSRRPVMQFNKCLRIGKRIVNDIKQAHFGIKYIPIGTEADPLVAEVYNAIVKRIERENRCESIRQAGFEQALFGGVGFWRIYTDWEDEKSFNKKIVSKRLVNRRQVLFSRSSVEPDLSDCTWFIIHEVLPLATAKAKYPKVEFRDTYGGEFDAAWTDGKEGVVVSEQFCLKYRPSTLIQFSSNKILKSGLVDEATKAMWQAMKPEGYPDQILWKEDLTDEQKTLWDALPSPVKARFSRPSNKKVWVWYKFAGRQLIKTQDWEGSIAPLVFCRGREVWLKGSRKWLSITTMLKDPQRLYNYYRSTQAERLTMAADAPWLLTAEHIAGYEDLWKTAHTKPLRFLLYNLKHNAEELPPPKRTDPIMGDPGLDREVDRLDREMLDIAGINLASLGEPSGERTGKAILVRQKQGELINADYPEGYVEALYREGQIYLDLIPKVYTWEQAMTFIGDEEKELVQQIQEQGVNGWGTGKYHLEIEIGAVSSTAREDEKTFWTELIQSNPQIAPIVMDKLVETLGNKNSKLLSKRFAALLPPQVQGITETSDGNNGQNPQVQAIQQQSQQQMQELHGQMQQMGQKLQEVTQENQKLTSDSSLKARELDIKQQEVEIKKLEVELQKEELQLKREIAAGAFKNAHDKITLEGAKHLDDKHEARDARSEASAKGSGTVQA